MENIDSDEEDFEEPEINVDESGSDQEEGADDETADIDCLPSFESRDGTKWQRGETASPVGRIPRRNIVKTPGGTKRFLLARVDNPIDVFCELFDLDSLEKNCERTIEEARRQNDENFFISVDEFKAFLGLAILRGVLKGRNEPLSKFWSETYGRKIFRQRMSRKKYKDILRYLRFDDKLTREERKLEDKFTPIREIWTIVLNNCQKHFFPYENVTIDEQLFPCRARCAFIQYMPQKPSKFGIKFWMICDTQTSYVLQAYPYIGRVENRGQAGLGEHVVMELMAPYFKSGINVTTDNFFTCLNVAKQLLKENVTLVGTLRQNCREIPAELKSKDLPLLSSKFVFSEPDKIMLLAYKAKRNKDERFIFCLQCIRVRTLLRMTESNDLSQYSFTMRTKVASTRLMRC